LLDIFIYKINAVFWQAGTTVGVGADAHLLGNLMTYTTIGLGARSSVLGRVISITATVIMDNNAIGVYRFEPILPLPFDFRTHLTGAAIFGSAVVNAGVSHMFGDVVTLTSQGLP
jgi:hypothetical protein